MSDQGFSQTQLDQLQSLIPTIEQIQSIVHEEVSTIVQKEIAEQDKRFEIRFAEERAYYRQLIKDELADIRDKLDRLSERAHDESKLALTEIEQLKKRLTRAEHEIAALKAA